MTWIIKFDGVEMSSDDLLIDDLAEIEKATGTPWSIANPLREMKVGRAFLAAALLRSGKTDDDVAELLGKATMRDLKRAFRYVEDDKDDDAEEASDAAPLDPTSHASSTGARGTAGRRLKSASSA